MKEKVQIEEILQMIQKMQLDVKRITSHVVKLRNDLNEIILLNTVIRANEQESQENEEA